MSKKPWRRDRTSGLSFALVERLDEDYLDGAGHIDPSRYPDCNVFNVSSAAALAGYKNPWRFRETALADSRFHHYKLRDPDDHLITVATHSTSAAWYGKQLRLDKIQVSRANLRRGLTNPSSGQSL